MVGGLLLEYLTGLNGCMGGVGNSQFLSCCAEECLKDWRI